MKFDNNRTTRADQQEYLRCPDCPAVAPRGGVLRHDGTCPLGRAIDADRDANRAQGDHVRGTTHAERQNLQLLGFSRSVTRRARVHVIGNARVFTLNGQAIAGYRDLTGGAA
jgi:hypothetical protein